MKIYLMKMYLILYNQMYSWLYKIKNFGLKSGLKIENSLRRIQVVELWFGQN